jgi:hypothetical protein
MMIERALTLLVVVSIFTMAAIVVRLDDVQAAFEALARVLR